MGIVVGVDLGKRRLGLAVSDPTERFAVLAEGVAVRGEGEVAEAIDQAARRLAAERLVIGLPRRMDGRLGPEARAAEKIAEQLRRLDWDVALWDERLTTGEAHASLKAGGFSRRQRMAVVDGVAALRILSSYLDHANRQSAAPETPPPPASPEPSRP